MVGNGKDKRKWWLAVQLCLHHTAIEGLAQCVRGDETKAFCLTGANIFGRLVPPVHDKVGGFRHFRIHGAERLRVAITQTSTHFCRSNKRRITDDVIGGGPFGRAWVGVSEQWHAPAVVGHFPAGHQVCLHAAAVPDGDDIAVVIAFWLRVTVVGEDGIAAFDVEKFFQHRLGWHCLAPGAEMPLEVANPQYKFGNGDSTWGDFKSKKLVRVHSEMLHLQCEFLVAEALEFIKDFALQSFHKFECDV